MKYKCVTDGFETIGYTINNPELMGGEINMDKKCCGNCFYFNGEKGDVMQFCDEKEIFVRETDMCIRYMAKERRSDADEPSGL